ncbi:uncharacterized protein LOC115175631 isoform X2 [Salmo trutta]|uniref:uncharacterized protein LOC115175631 isoform X2 n=1 Tax=Salmo trutta TaxID=8032 RepID=UPI0011324642|nr:uncharacterized protein LOC115175631 isoform X2 [Salmo trutta]
MRRSHKQGREHSAGIAGYKIKVLWLEDVDQCLYSRGRLFSVRMDSGIVRAFLQCQTEDGDIRCVSDKVTAHCNKRISLNKPKGYKLKIGHQDDTVYKGNKKTPEEWSDVERDSDEIQKKQDAHKCFLKSTEEEFLRNLEIIKRKLPTQNKKMPERQCERATVEDPKKKLRSNCDHLCLSSLI